MHVTFVDYEKAFDQVKRPKLWEIMLKKANPQHLNQVIKGLYNNTCIYIDMDTALVEIMQEWSNVFCKVTVYPLHFLNFT